MASNNRFWLLRQRQYGLSAPVVAVDTEMPLGDYYILHAADMVVEVTQIEIGIPGSSSVFTQTLKLRESQMPVPCAKEFA